MNEVAGYKGTQDCPDPGNAEHQTEAGTFPIPDYKNIVGNGNLLNTENSYVLTHQGLKVVQAQDHPLLYLLTRP